MAEVDVPPTVVRGPVDGWNVHDWDVEWMLDDDADIQDIEKYRLTDGRDCVGLHVWDDLVQRMWAATGRRLPGFPLWADAWSPSVPSSRSSWTRSPEVEVGHPR